MAARLLVRIIALVAVLIGAVVATARADAWWAAALHALALHATGRGAGAVL